MHHLMYILTSHLLLIFKGTVVMHKLWYILSFLAKTILQQKPITSFLNLSDLKVLPTTNDAQLK